MRCDGSWSHVCELAGLLAWGVWQRHRQTAAMLLDPEDGSRVTPATTAGEAITREIPDVLTAPPPDPAESADEAEAGEPVGTSDSASGPAPALIPPPFPPASPPRLPAPEPPVRRSEPTPEERRLAEARARALEAVLAPTAVPTTGSAITAAPVPDRSATVTEGDSDLRTLIETLGAGANSPRLPTPPGPDGDAYTEQNMQAEKEAFLAGARNTGTEDYLPSTRVSPLSRYVIRAGWEIPAVLEQELNSDLPGELKALVTTHVYDTATGRWLLIPQGSRLVGAYNANIAYGQSALQVVWHRIIFPDASSIDLGGMTGQDARGTSGFRGEVDNHYGRLIGFTLLSSVFSAGFQISQNRGTSVLRNPGVGEVAAGAVGQEVSQLGTDITRRNLNVQPTIRIPVGHRFNVRVNRDILFEAPYTR